MLTTTWPRIMARNGVVSLIIFLSTLIAVGNAAPCPPNVSAEWVVNDTASAEAMAKGVDCSGADFSVEWRGHVVLDRQIVVAAGSSLRVTGQDPENSGITGAGDHRIFSVINASLNVSNLSISNGHAIHGGAISAEGSTLWFENTLFSNNTAAIDGGAVFVSDGSTATWHAESSFSNNIAGVDGGAVSLNSTSTATWQATSLFVNNTADGHGGVVFAREKSSATWQAESSFIANTAGSAGGVVFASEQSSATWQAESSFTANTAGLAGGVVFASEQSSATWQAESSFAANTAGSTGGVVFAIEHSSATWQAESTFSNNAAGTYHGGVVAACKKSSATWQAESSFTANTAGSTGGVVFACEESSVAWQANSTFSNNVANASHGGVVLVITSSSTIWQAESSFSGNTAGHDGGAVAVLTASSVTWQGKSSFVNNSASFSGGAVAIYNESSATWRAESLFSGNNAGTEGGAVAVEIISSAIWQAESSFFNNSAGSSGGAVYGWDRSNAMWQQGSSFFSNNTAEHGGAVSLSHGFNAVWQAESSFCDNSAGVVGGAVYGWNNSNATWEAESSFFSNNAANHGGAVFVDDGVKATWQTNSSFVDNRAGAAGGAVAVWSTSSVTWQGNSSFCNNTSGTTGGAVFIYGFNVVTWGIRTLFFNNSAVGNGGAISVIQRVFGDLPYLHVDGETDFVENKCRGSGGGMAIIGGMNGDFLQGTMIFNNNSADINGGAISVTGAVKGLEFVGLSFSSNTARIGGAVYVTGSGTTVDLGETDPKHPTTFDQCSFESNAAQATGGAVDSGAGLDEFVNSSFVRNTARVGGALRLAGTASLRNCTFDENTSSNGEGPAISNVGYISSLNNSYFCDNVFQCDEGEFLDFNESSALGDEDFFDTACATCETSCTNCQFKGKLPICTEQLENTISDGGDVVLETLSIHGGYWRATTTSREILPCYHQDACSGGVSGLNSSCAQGYEGPYCSVCSENYSPGLGHTCTKCGHDGVRIAIVVIACVLSTMAFLPFVAFMVFNNSGLDRGVGSRLARWIPVQSLKVTIVSWQIITQFVEVANVTYPGIYQQFLNIIDVINFDLTWLLTAECVFDVDFHDSLIVVTVGPLIGAAVLGATYLLATTRKGGSGEAAVRVARQKHLSAFLLLTFMVYSSVSSTLFQMYACDELDNGKNYLRADYRIECDSPKHEALQVYAGFMVILYTAGIPLFYTTLLLNSRAILTDKIARETDERAISISNLWKAYRPQRFYYEVIDLFRRISLAGLVVFIYPNSAAQIAITIVLAGTFTISSEAIAPYESQWDTWVSRMGHVIILMSMYVALLLKVDVSTERTTSQNIFEAVLVAAHACMFLAVVVEAIAICQTLKTEESAEPRRRSLAVDSFYREEECG